MCVIYVHFSNQAILLSPFICASSTEPWHFAMRASPGFQLLRADFVPGSKHAPLPCARPVPNCTELRGWPGSPSASPKWVVGTRAAPRSRSSSLRWMRTRIGTWGSTLAPSGARSRCSQLPSGAALLSRLWLRRRTMVRSLAWQLLCTRAHEQP